MTTAVDRSHPFQLVVLDMNGTTVHDHGVFDIALERAFREIDLALPSPDRIAPHRGKSKTEMFQQLVPDPGTARRAYQTFTESFLDAVRAGLVEAVPGADLALARLHDDGARTCLVTGFAPDLQTAIVDHLRWSDVVDLTVSTDDVPRGRPHPDVIHHAAHRLGITDPATVVVVGDTTNDLLAGARAGAGLLVGVLTGAHSRSQLGEIEHAQLISSIADLPQLLAETPRPRQHNARDRQIGGPGFMT